MAWLSFETRRHSITQKQSPAKSCQFSVMQACSHLASLAAALKIKSADIALSLVVLCFAFICLCLFMLNFSPISCRLFLMVFMQCCALRAQPVTQHAARQSVVLVFFSFSKKHCSFDVIKYRHDTDVQPKKISVFMMQHNALLLLAPSCFLFCRTDFMGTLKWMLKKNQKKGEL